MIKTFSGQVVFCFAISQPYLPTFAKTDYPSIGLDKQNFERKNCKYFLTYQF